MKNFNLFSNKHFRFVAVLCLLLSLCSSKAWGALSSPSSCTFSAAGGSKTLSDDNSDVTWTASTAPSGFEGTGTARGLQWTGATVNATGGLTLTCSSYAELTITQIAVVWSRNNNAGATVSAKVGGVSFGSADTNTATTTNRTATFTGSASGTITINATSTASKNSFYIKSITVTYTTGSTKTLVYDANGGSGSMKNTTGATVNAATCTFTPPACKVFDHWNTASNDGGASYNEGDAVAASTTLYAIWVNNPSDPTQTFSNGSYTTDGSALDLSTLFSSNSSGAVTYSVTNAGGTGASIAGSSFTATTAGSCTVQASQAADAPCYNAKTATATITVSTPAPATITLNNYSGSATTTGYHSGESFTLPSTNDFTCGDLTFVGWSSVTINDPSATKPASNYYEPGESVTLGASNTFYAVFAEASGGDPVPISGGDMASSLPSGWSAKGTDGFYSGNGVKFDNAQDYIISGDISSHGLTSVTVKFKAGYNGYEGSVLRIEAINKDGYEIGGVDFVPTETYTNQNTVNTVVVSASSTIYSIAVELKKKTSNVGVKYCEVFKGGTTYSAYSTTCQACVEPTNPTNTSITAYGATIGWTGGGTGTLDRYEYAVWMDGDDEPTSGFTSNGTNTSNALTGLLSNTTYRWKVRKVCTGGDGESMWLKSSFTTSNVALTFSVPTGASAVPGQNSDEALPSAEVPTNCGDCWAFVGWTTAEHAESSSAPAKLFASDAIVHLAQADGSTLYAVYKKDEFKLIKATSQMENNGYYVLTSLHESHEYAMTNVLNGKYATSTDVTSLISEPEVDNYLLKNPSESTIWKFTGTASSGRFYNESSGLYLDLTEKEGAILKSSTTDNLVITIPNVKELAFDIASVAESSHYLYMWTSHQWSVDNAHRIGTDNSAYLYKRISLVYATTPSCPIYTVTWDVNGASTSTTEVTKCEGYLSALPGAPADNTLSGCQTNGKFMGWSASKVMPAQDIAPADIFSEVEDAPEITEDVTFYAVFANGVAGAATPVNTTYTFNSKLWGDATNSWSSNTAGSELTSERGIQILGNTSAEGITKNNYTDVTKVVVTYCTNASSGAGSVTVTVGDTEFGTNSISKPSSGGATLKTFTYTHAAATGKVKISASASSSSIYIYSVQIYYTGAGTVYEQYRTACCNDPGFSFTGENDAPVTEYVIVRENMASASDAVEIDCNYTSSNTTGAITWYSTRRAAKTFPSTGAYTWTTPTEQPTNLNIDLANKKIAAKETGVWTITISQADGGTTYCPVDAVVTVRVKTVDKFIDNVNGNFSGEAQRLEDVGNGITLPTETTFTINGGCSDGVTRRLVGWIKASDLATYASGGRVNKIDDWKTADPATNKVIAPGTKVQATGVTWYAVWGVEK